MKRQVVIILLCIALLCAIVEKNSEYKAEMKALEVERAEFHARLDAVSEKLSILNKQIESGGN